MEPSRYELVNSLYGSGTVGAWLLTICAVLISWTANVTSRWQDTISMDFIALLLLPLVSTAHFILQVTRLPTSVAEPITSMDTEMQKAFFRIRSTTEHLRNIFARGTGLGNMLWALVAQRPEVEAAMLGRYDRTAQLGYRKYHVRHGHIEWDTCRKLHPHQGVFLFLDANHGQYLGVLVALRYDQHSRLGY